MVRYKHWKKTDELTWVNDSGAILEITRFSDEVKWYDVTLWNAKDKGNHAWSEAIFTKASALEIVRDFIKNNDNANVTLTDLQIRFNANFDKIYVLGVWEEAYFTDEHEETVSLRFKGVEKISLKDLSIIQEVFGVSDTQVVVAKNSYNEFCVVVTKPLA